MDEGVPIGPTTVVRQSPDHLSAEVDGEVVFYVSDREQYYALDEIGTDIWGRLAEPQSIDDLCQSLVRDYDASADVIRAEVVALLEELRAQELIEVAE